MTQALTLLDKDSLLFPPLKSALNEPNGLLAFGGDLSTLRLLSAYSQGIFPWFSENEPLMWWSPSPRAIIKTKDIRINKTLAKVLRQKKYHVTLNHAFEQVIDFCSDAPFRKEGTWILPDMLNAYKQLHTHGSAHSIEVWLDNELVGGLYGVAINGYFSGESMFYTKSNASKIALVYLAKLLEEQNVSFIDCQMENPFLKGMGCEEIKRTEFVLMKDAAMNIHLPKEFWAPRQL